MTMRALAAHKEYRSEESPHESHVKEYLSRKSRLRSLSGGTYSPLLYRQIYGGQCVKDLRQCPGIWRPDLRSKPQLQLRHCGHRSQQFCCECAPGHMRRSATRIPIEAV